MEDIKIVEYNPDYAKGVAEMWNLSGSSWGGDMSILTEEAIVMKKSTTPDLNMYLALCGDKVVGYCGLSEYREDEGSLYIPLLNVVPEYHGKKIGKLLVKKIVERTVELGWPRVDLYTWPGNTKAVPLYKKCGFFWERRDDTTHLMNFIPTVLQTEAVEDFFAIADWYDDSQRIIEIKPDGDTVNQIDYYQYSWEKSGRRLKMEFERRSRGLRLIETDDYLISVSLSKQELVFNGQYVANYQIVNKSGKDLHLSLKGRDDHNITYDFEADVVVQDQLEIAGQFFVGEIDEELDNFKTQPSVITDLLINGKRACFKIGVITKFPAKLVMSIPTKPCLVNVSSEIYLDLENNFEEAAVFTFELPDTDWLSFAQREFALTLNGKEKKSITFNYILKSFGYYAAKIPVKIQLDTGETIEFVKELSVIFQGNRGKFGGKTENGWVVCHGSNRVELRKRNNYRLIYTHGLAAFDEMFLVYPQLGKPYSLEFSKGTPKSVVIIDEDDAVVLKATYQSRAFAGIEVHYISRLFANGIVENYYEVQNVSDQISDEVSLKDGSGFSLLNGYFSYKGEIVQIADSIGAELSLWDGGITENWLFSKGYSVPRGLWWPEEFKPKITHNALYMEHNIGQIPGKTSKVTKPIYFAVGTFQSWQELRNYVRGQEEQEYLPIVDHAGMTVNNGNPFVSDSFNVKVKERKLIYMSGQITLRGEKESFAEQVVDISATEERNEVEIPLKLSANAEQEIVNLYGDFEYFTMNRRSMVFKVSDQEIKQEIIQEADLAVMVVDNGRIRIKSSPDFYHCLYSLTYNDREWFDSSFPKAGPHSWYNPWMGGLWYSQNGLSDETMMKEKITGEFVQRFDNFKNKWTGIKTRVLLEEPGEYQGLEIEQYYLMLPGLPILAYFVELTSHVGRNLPRVYVFPRCFLKPDEQDLTQGWFMTRDSYGQMNHFKTGKGGVDVFSTSPALVGATTHNDRLLIYPGSQSVGFEVFTNMVDIGIFFHQTVDLKDQNKLTLPVRFFIFTDDYIEDELLKDLRQIAFA